MKIQIRTKILVIILGAFLIPVLFGLYEYRQYVECFPVVKVADLKDFIKYCDFKRFGINDLEFVYEEYEEKMMLIHKPIGAFTSVDFPRPAEKLWFYDYSHGSYGWLTSFSQDGTGQYCSPGDKQPSVG